MLDGPARLEAPPQAGRRCHPDHATSDQRRSRCSILIRPLTGAAAHNQVVGRIVRAARHKPPGATRRAWKMGRRWRYTSHGTLMSGYSSQ